MESDLITSHVPVVRNLPIDDAQALFISSNDDHDDDVLLLAKKRSNYKQRLQSARL